MLATAATRPTRFIAALTLLLLPGLVGVDAAASAGQSTCDKQCQDDLDRARKQTEQYWLVDEAVRSGYVESGRCEGTQNGTRGIRYRNPAASLDQTVDVEHPESLIYMQEGLYRLGRRLVAVEYSVPITWDGQESPVLFGREFDGPMEPNSDGVAEYRLRAWLHSDNPAGMFAPANPADSCDGASLIAPHAVEEDVHEVFARFTVKASAVRKAVELPSGMYLRGEKPDSDTDSDVELWIDARFSRWSDGTGPLQETHLAFALLPLEAPDWAGDQHSAFANLYPLSWITDNPDLGTWARQRTGAGIDVVRNGEIQRDFNPIGAPPNYLFRSPDFDLEATVVDAGAPGASTTLRVWHENPRDMGHIRAWHDQGRGGAANAEVTPTSGTVLARLLCDNGDTCGPQPAELALFFATDVPSAWTASVTRDWWNPRHTTDSGGFGDLTPERAFARAGVGGPG